MKIVVHNNVSLDGVMQAPGGAEEDTRGGFQQGGWAHASGQDPEIMEAVTAGFDDPGPMLFGRRTYEQFHSYWPQQADNPFTDVLNRARKYVASRTLSEPLPWENSVLLEGDAVEAVAELKRGEGKDVVILGSGDLVRSLLARDLIDRLELLIHPVVLGGGTRLFAAEGPRSDWRLTRTISGRTGVILATYERS
jgi:dihydrofolate reductase